MHNHSYENEFNLHVNEIPFSYERINTKTRFEKEAKGNSEMACSLIKKCKNVAISIKSDFLKSRKLVPSMKNQSLTITKISSRKMQKIPNSQK